MESTCFSVREFARTPRSAEAGHELRRVEQLSNVLRVRPLYGADARVVGAAQAPAAAGAWPFR